MFGFESGCEAKWSRFARTVLPMPLLKEVRKTYWSPKSDVA